MRKKWITLGMAVLTAAAVLAGCGNAEGAAEESVRTEESAVIEAEDADGQEEAGDPAEMNTGEDGDHAETVSELTVRFGDDGEPFTMYLYDNDTAAAIAGYVGQNSWRLPIYHYDDYDNWEVMQYYDIPSRYEIPDNPEEVTSVKAGAVYYSEPNRIILFYHDAEISGAYTPVGYFDATDEFVQAVEENPVLEGWGNKIVQIEQ